MLAAVGIGLAGELSALGLLATGGWLLLSASLRPPILLLSIAIGAVQLFSLLPAPPATSNGWPATTSGSGCRPGCAEWLYHGCSAGPTGLPGGDRGDLLAQLGP